MPLEIGRVWKLPDIMIVKKRLKEVVGYVFFFFFLKTPSQYLSINVSICCTGVLKVGGETKEGVPVPTIPRQSDIPDLTMPHYFFGGVPPGFKAPFILPQSFLGCMSDLQVLQEVYNPMKGAFWGVQKTCNDKVKCKKETSFVLCIYLLVLTINSLFRPTYVYSTI